MKKIVNSVLQLVGDTPMVELERLGRDAGAVARVVAKVELFNPAGSVKDRVALAMVERAEADGALRPGATIIEPTSGNTGVGLALVSALKGYRLILTMPETMSVERRRLVAAYGAQVVLTPGAEGMKGAIAGRRRSVRRFPARSSSSSSRTPPTPRGTTAPPPRRSGATPRAESTFSWPGSARAEPSAAQAAGSKS